MIFSSQLRTALALLFICTSSLLQLLCAGFVVSGVGSRWVKVDHRHLSSSSLPSKLSAQGPTDSDPSTVTANAIHDQPTITDKSSSSSNSLDLNVMELSCPIPIEGASMHLIGGRRCLRIPSRSRSRSQSKSRSKRRNSNRATHTATNENSSESMTLPLVILGGMAQCIESWQHHFLDFSRDRDVLMIEYLGQGLAYKYEFEERKMEVAEDTYYAMSDLDSQARDIPIIIQKLFSSSFSDVDEGEDTNMFHSMEVKVDIIAFSLGARIAMAIMAHHPNLIRKAHLTGIGANRDEMGKIIFQSWNDLLSPDASNASNKHGGDYSNDYNALRSFAWSILLATYSKSFLSMNGAEKVSSWVDHICTNNRRMGLYALLTHTSSVSPMEHADVIRSRIKTNGNDNGNEWKTIVQIVVGGDDMIVPVEEARKLNDAIPIANLDANDIDNGSSSSLSSSRDVMVYANCGHAVLNENAREWRKDAMKFLLE